MLEKYLDSIATLLGACTDHESLAIRQFMLRHVISIESVCSQIRALNSLNKAKVLRNLRN